MEEQKKKSGLKPKLQRAKAKFLASYYSNPAKDLRIIAITGNSGRDVTAHFLKEIIKFQDDKVDVIIDPATTSDLYKQLSRIWKTGANNVVISITSQGLANHLFYQLPIYETINTDVEPLPPVASIMTPTTVESDARDILFNTQPNFNIISRDHPEFDTLSNYPVKTATFSYGHDRNADLSINRFKLYKKGTEANLRYGNENFDVATYETGEESVNYMAAAALGALALGANFDEITDGIANFERKN